MIIQPRPGIYYFRGGRMFSKPMLKKSKRVITQIFIHCSATMPNRNFTAKDIDRWHKDRGWSGIGYNGVITRDGSFEKGRDVDLVPAHAYGYNKNSIGICLIGGLGYDNHPEPIYTNKQWATLKRVIKSLQKQYPNAEVLGHNETANKACPSFDVKHWLNTGEVRL